MLGFYANGMQVALGRRRGGLAFGTDQSLTGIAENGLTLLAGRTRVASARDGSARRGNHLVEQCGVARLAQTGANRFVRLVALAVQLLHELGAARCVGRFQLASARFQRYDQHVEIQTKGSSKSVITILLRGNIGIAYDSTLPPLGSMSQGLRILSQTWSAAHDTLTLDVAGKAGCDYELGVFDNGESLVHGQGALASVEGGDLFASKMGEEKIKIAFPAGNSGDYAHRKIVLHFPNSRK